MDKIHSFITIFPEKDVSSYIPNNDFESNLDSWSGSDFAWTNQFDAAEGRAELRTSSSLSYLTCTTASIVIGKKYRLEYTVKHCSPTTEHHAVVGSAKTKRKYGPGVFSMDIVPLSTTPLRLIFKGGNVYTPGSIVGSVITPDKPGASFCSIKLYEVSEYNLDIYEDLDLKLNLSIAEREDISKRNSTYSKTVVLPGTPNNNIIFKTAYLVSTANSFPLNYPVRINVYDDDCLIFQGYSILQRIILSQTDTIVKYEISLYSCFIDFYTKIGDYFLTGNTESVYDLDFSEWNHVLNNTNITSSWWKGSQINPGYNNLPVQQAPNNALGKGYVYPLINYGFSSTKIENNQLRPALFIKEIWDKIFEKAGFTYRSNFLNSYKFTRLIYPSVKPLIISDSSAAIRDASYKDTTAYTLQRVTHNWNGGATDDYKQGIVNTLTQTTGLTALGAGYKYIVPKKGLYDISVSVDKVKFYISSCYNISFLAFGDLYDNTGLSKVARLKIELIKVSSDASLPSTTLASTDCGIDNSLIAGGIVAPKWPAKNWYQSAPATLPATIDVSSVLLDAGEYLELRATLRSDHNSSNFVNALGQPVWTAVGVEFPANYTTMTVKGVAGATVFEDDWVDLNQVLHSDVKQSDFVASIIKMFNLYIEPDNEDPFLLYIEPRDYYYGAGSSVVKDWTMKRDLSREFQIEEATDMRHKNLLFKYSDDKDNHNTSYTNSVQHTWGEKFIEADQKTREKVIIQPIFAPTPNDNFITSSNKGKIVVPTIYKLDESGRVSPENFLPRILYWGGLQYWDTTTSGGNYWITSPTQAPLVYSKGHKSNFYPYAGHFDKPFGNEDYDLDFGANYWYYQSFPTGHWATYNNLYYAYYAKMIDELFDNDSRLVTTWVYLNGYDIKKFKFNDVIQIDENFYRVNKIIDYSPNTVTKVELLKVREMLGDYIPGPWATAGHNGKISAGAFKKLSLKHLDNHPKIGINDIHIVGPSKSNTIIGTHIHVQDNVRNFFAIGSTISVGANVSNSSIISSTNIIFDADIDRVSVIGSNNIKVTESNVTYINNVKFKNGLIYTPVHIVNGGKNCVTNPFSAKIPNVVSSGLNAVREMGSMSEVNIIKNE